MKTEPFLWLIAIILVSACTPIAGNTPTMPTSENIPIPTLMPSPTRWATRTPTITPIPWGEDTDIVFFKQDIIERCPKFDDFETNKLTIENYALLTYCKKDDAEKNLYDINKLCKISFEEGMIKETFLIEINGIFPNRNFTTPDGEWFFLVDSYNSNKFVKIFTKEGAGLNSEGIKVDIDLRIVDWLDNETLLLDSGKPSAQIHEYTRLLASLNPFTNVMNKKTVFLEGINTWEIYSMFRVNHSFDQVFFFQTFNVELPYNSVVSDIDSNEVLWKGVNGLYHIDPQWSLDDSYLVVQNQPSNEDFNSVNSYKSIAIVGRGGKLINTLWFNFVDDYASMVFYWSPDSKYLSIFIRNVSQIGDNQLYLFDMETNQLINTCITLKTPANLQWSPDSKGFTTTISNQTINHQFVYYEVAKNRIYPLPEGEWNFGWLKK